MAERTTNANHALVSIENQVGIIPGAGEWKLMRDMAASLVPTGFLPESIKTPEQAVAIMLKGRELNVPPMYALSNIVIVKGKPSVSAEMMLALIYRDHGKRAIRVKSSDDRQCTVEYRLDGWDDVLSYGFTIEQAGQAGLLAKDRNGNPTNWHRYPAAMLRARCISAVARMAFPECIAGMYVPGELGDDVRVTDDGEVLSVGGGRSANIATGEIIDATPTADAHRDVRTTTATVVQVDVEPADFSGSEAWQRASRRLHAVANNVVGPDAGHEVMHIMAEIKGYASITHMEPDHLHRMAAFMEGDPDVFARYYGEKILPRLNARDDDTDASDDPKDGA